MPSSVDPLPSCSAHEQQPDCNDGQQPFIASSNFTGAKAGYIFTTRKQGTGYYKELESSSALPPPPPKDQGKQKPMVIKSRSIVKVANLPAPAEKKRKLDSTDEDKPKYLKEMERYRSLSCSSAHTGDRPLVK